MSIKSSISCSTVVCSKPSPASNLPDSQTVRARRGFVITGNPMSSKTNLPAHLALPSRASALNPTGDGAQGLALPLLIIVVLEIVVRLGWLPSYQMPAPSEIALTLDLAEAPVETHQRQPVARAARVSPSAPAWPWCSPPGSA
jgi:hypothetical protein